MKFAPPGFLAHAFVVSILTCTAACSEERCPPAEVCDIRTGDCQQRAMRTAACLRGDDPDAVAVAVELIDADTFIDEVVREAETSSDERSPEHASYQRGLVLVGLADDEGSVETDLRGHYENVAAFYSSATRSVTILDRGNPLDDDSAMALLVHEMVHALQDEAQAFASIRGAKSWDMWLARRAMTEGEATLVQMRASLQLNGLRDGEVDWEGWLGDWQADIEERALSSPDLVRDARLLFPYAWGAEHVRRVEREGGRAAVRALFREAAPDSTAEVLGLASEAPSGDFAERAVPRPGSPWTLSSVSHLGAWITERWLERLGHYAVTNISGNDALSVFDAPSNAAETPHHAAFWRFDTPSIDDANQLAEALDGAGEPALYAVAAGNEVWVAARTVEDELAPELAWGKHEGADLFFGASSASPASPAGIVCTMQLGLGALRAPPYTP